jgi:hypothetical protein
MQLAEHTKKSTVEQREHKFTSLSVWKELSWALISTVSGVLAMLTAFIFKAPTSSTANAISTGQRLSFFIAGLLALAVIIAGVATIIRRKNRGVILLKTRLAEIYLSALRQSALNPGLQSPTSDE